MKIKLLILICVSVCVYPVKTKVFEKCEFARIAKDNGLSDIGTWTCIAYHESHLNSAAKGGGFYGILQISSEYWCGAGRKCGISCQSLLDVDLSNDLQCAKQIYSLSARIKGKSGFSPWFSSHYCKGNQQQWIKDCNI